MAPVFDASSYFTRRQSDARYVRLPTPPNPPSALAFTSSTVVLNDNISIAANASFTLTPPVGGQVSQYLFEFTDPLAVVTTQALPSQNLPFVCVGLQINTVYGVRVRSIDFFGQVSTFTGSISITTSNVVPPLQVPELTGISVLDGALLFVSPLNDEIFFSFYRLFRSTAANMSSPTDIVDFTGDTFLDRVIPATANYWYQVEAHDKFGNSVTTNIVGPLALTQSTLPAFPATPNILGGSIVPNSDGSITIHWPANTENTLTNFRIWRRVHLTALWEQFDFISGAPGVNGVYTDVNTISGTSYDFSVSAINSANEESSFNSTGLTAASLCTDAPAAPSVFVYSNAQGTVGISWTGSVSSGSSSSAAVQYEFQYQLLTTDPYYPPFMVNGPAFTLYGLIDSRVALGGELGIRIRARNNAGNFSSYLTHTISFAELINYSPAPNSRPSNPLLISHVDNADGSESLSWAAPSFSPGSGEVIFGYRIMRWDTVLSEFVFLADHTGSTAYTDTFLEPFSFASKKYQYSVQVLGTMGDISPWNFLQDSGFEFNNSSWVFAADAGAVDTFVTTPVRDGTKALRNNYAGRAFQRVSVVHGKKYTLSAFAEKDAIAITARIRISWRDVSDGVLSEVNNTVVVNTSYQSVSILNQTAPPTAVTAVLFLDADPGGPTDTVFWDDTYFEESPIEDGYGDNKSNYVQVIDTTAPVETELQLAAAVKGILGGFNLTWLTGVNPRFLGAVYEIFKAALVGGPFITPIATMPVFAETNPEFFDVTSVSILTRDTEYFNFKVKDIYGNESGLLLAVAIAATSLNLNDVPTFGNISPPAQPSGIVSIANPDGSITTTWNANVEANLDGYVVYRRVNSGSANAGELPPDSFVFNVATVIKSGPGGTPTFTDPNLVQAITYDYSVAAFNTDGIESTFNIVSFGTATANDSRIPAVPTNLSAVGITGLITNAWHASSTILVERFDVAFSTDAGSTWSSTTRVTGNTFIVHFTSGETSAFLTTNYRFRVRAVSPSGTVQSAYATTSITDMTKFISVNDSGPSAVTSLVATPVVNDSVVLTWHDPNAATAAVDHYRILRQYGVTGFVFLVDVRPATPGGDSTYTDVGLQPFYLNSTYYSYQVYAITTTGAISASTEVDNVVVVLDTQVPSMKDVVQSVVYIPSALPAWQTAHTYAGSVQILDPNGYIQESNPGGLSGGTIPTFNQVFNGITPDGAGALVWNNLGPANSLIYQLDGLLPNLTSGLSTKITVNGCNTPALNVQSYPITLIDTGTNRITIAVLSDPIADAFNLTGNAQIIAGGPNVGTVQVTQITDGLINPGDIIVIDSATSAALDGTWVVLTAVLATGVWTLTFNTTGAPFASTAQSAGTVTDETAEGEPSTAYLTDLAVDETQGSLVWSAFRGRSYLVEIATDSGFSAIVLSKAVVNQLLRLDNLTILNQRYIRVTASNSAGNGIAVVTSHTHTPVGLLVWDGADILYAVAYPASPSVPITVPATHAVFTQQIIELSRKQYVRAGWELA